MDCNRRGEELEEMLLGCLSLTVLASVMAFLRERRLRLVLRELLQRLLTRWRKYVQSQDGSCADDDVVGSDIRL